MKCLLYQVAVGPTRPLYEECISSAKRYSDRHTIEHLVQRQPLLRIAPLESQRSSQAVDRLGYLPIYEKENAFAYLSEYDLIAIVDSDVYLTDDAPNIFDEIPAGICFAGVVERSMPLTERYLRKLRAYSNSQYGPLRGEADFAWDENGAEFFNMGVMVVTRQILQYLDGQTPEEFIRRAEFQRFVDGEGAWRWSTDQTLLNYWIKRSGMAVKHLSWKWNALFKGIKDDCLVDAHFIHFFLSDHLPRRGAEVPEIIQHIREGVDSFRIRGRG